VTPFQQELCTELNSGDGRDGLLETVIVTVTEWARMMPWKRKGRVVVATSGTSCTSDARSDRLDASHNETESTEIHKDQREADEFQG
jgi:hypothetical protein